MWRCCSNLSWIFTSYVDLFALLQVDIHTQGRAGAWAWLLQTSLDRLPWRICNGKAVRLSFIFKVKKRHNWLHPGKGKMQRWNLPYVFILLPPYYVHLSVKIKSSNSLWLLNPNTRWCSLTCIWGSFPYLLSSSQTSTIIILPFINGIFFFIAIIVLSFFENIPFFSVIKITNILTWF